MLALTGALSMNLNLIKFLTFFSTVLFLNLALASPPINQVTICDEIIPITRTKLSAGYGPDAWRSQSILPTNCRSSLVPQTISYNTYYCSPDKKWDTFSSYGSVGYHCADLSDVVAFIEVRCMCKKPTLKIN